LERRGLVHFAVLYSSDNPADVVCWMDGHRVSPRAVTGACRSPRFVLAASMPSASVALQ